MSKLYDFYKCKKDFEDNCMPLPDDINQPVVEWLVKYGCEKALPDIDNIQKNGLFGQYKVGNKNKPNIIYVFKFQSGMIINWDVVTTVERDDIISEITRSYKNKFLEIKKKDKRNVGSSEDRSSGE